MDTLYDIVIVGAGPAGSATGHYLAKQGFKVLLLDKFTFPRDKTCGDALTPRALRILEEMEILDDVFQAGHSLNSVEFVSPHGYSAIAPIPHQERRTDTLLFVPRLLLDTIILERACTSGAEFQSPVRVTAIVRAGQEMIVSGEQGRHSVSFRTRMVVIATGANVKLLVQTGILKKIPLMTLCSRAYFEGVHDALKHAQCRFDGVPLPGYGWIFPLSNSRVNVGIGLFKTGVISRSAKGTAKIFDTFLQTPYVQTLLAGAQQVGPTKGYPLRVDFAHSPTFSDGVLLVGEAAGLVNPVTGEGIDYALESGKIAAEHLTHMLTSGDTTSKQQLLYDQRLRKDYQRLFVICDTLRFLYLNPLILNRVIRSAGYNKDLMTLFMNIAIENMNVHEGLAPKTLAKVILGNRGAS